MLALVTGATGFIGSHVARTLLDHGLDVRVLVRPQTDPRALHDWPVKIVHGDLRDPLSLKEAVGGVDLLFHVAADYRFWVPDPATMHAINVDGTITLLRAAAQAGVSRMVYTSSVVTVACERNGPGTEPDFVAADRSRSTYQRTKVLAEHAVWGLIREGYPITIVNPSTPLGAGDLRPTPTGRLIVDFLNRRLPAYLDAGLNWVPVRDVALGHWLAATRGRVGERYILGGENLWLGDFLRILSGVSGLPAPRMAIPYAVAYLAGLVGSAWGHVTGREPKASLDGVRMAARPMFYDSSKARSELGLPCTPIPVAADEAVRWFRDHGYATTGGTA
jgi:dihydroflavonol-4-reductase